MSGKFQCFAIQRSEPWKWLEELRMLLSWKMTVYIYIPYNKAYTQGFLKDFSLGRQENLALVPQTNKSSSLGKGSAKSGIQPAMRKNRIITSCIRSKTAQGKLINSLASLIRVILLTSYCAPSNAGVWHITEVFSFLKVVKCSAEHAVLSVLL